MDHVVRRFQDNGFPRPDDLLRVRSGQGVDIEKHREMALKREHEGGLTPYIRKRCYIDYTIVPAL